MPDLAMRGTLPAGPQLRSYPAQFEIRSVSGAPSKVELRGYASVFDKPYDMYDAYGPYEEVARAGMFSKTLGENADVAYLANHEGLTMARTASGSLSLEQDSTGLLTSAIVNTQRNDVRDLVTAIEDGDVDQMSFAFRVIRQNWSPDYTQRDLIEVDLNRGDVSAVNFGASPSTNVGIARAYRSARAADIHKIALDLRNGGPITPRVAQLMADVFDDLASREDRSNKLNEPVGDDTAIATLEYLKRQLDHERRD